MPEQQPTALRDIYNSFITHLFEHGNTPRQRVNDGNDDQSSGRTRDLSFKANRQLFLNLTECLYPQDSVKKAHLKDFLAWLQESDLNNIHHQYQMIGLKIEKIEHVSEHLTKKQNRKLIKDLRKDLNKDLTKFFTELVGFSLMKVDPLYHQIYYADIYHPALSPSILTFVKNTVLVPFNQGSVGVASRKGKNELSNSFSDPNGTVAVEDLLQGNVAIMMVGAGLHPVAEINKSITTPTLRRQVTDNGTWGLDLLDWGANYCSTVVFCYFPLAGIFEARPEPSGVRLEAGGDLFRLFDHICRNYESSLVRELDYHQAKFVSQRTSEALDQKIDESGRVDTLEILASLKTPHNPTGGLIAYHTERPDIKVCIPIVEKRLSPMVERILNDNNPGADLQVDTSNGLTISDDPFTRLIRKRLGMHYLPNLDIDNILPDQKNPYLVFQFHGARNVDQVYSNDMSLPNNSLLYSFFKDIYSHHFLRWANGFSRLQEIPEEDRISFEDGKIAVDACEQVVGAIARVICRQLSGKELRDLAHYTWRSIRLTYRHLQGHTQFSGQDSAKEVERVLRLLSIKAAGLRNEAIAVSAAYWTPYHIEPKTIGQLFVAETEEFNKNVEYINREMLKHEGLEGQRFLRRSCIKALFNFYEHQRQGIPFECESLVGTSVGPLILEAAHSNLSAQQEGLTFNLKKDGKVIAKTNWKVDPNRYCLAKFIINSEIFHSWINSEINGKSPETHPVVMCLCDYLKARPQEIPDFNSKYRLFSYNGHWTEDGMNLIRRMELYEERLGERGLLAAASARQEKLENLTRTIVHGFQKGATNFPVINEQVIAIEDAGIRLPYGTLFTTALEYHALRLALVDAGVRGYADSTNSDGFFKQIEVTPISEKAAGPNTALLIAHAMLQAIGSAALDDTINDLNHLTPDWIEEARKLRVALENTRPFRLNEGRWNKNSRAANSVFNSLSSGSGLFNRRVVILGGPCLEAVKFSWPTKQHGLAMAYKDTWQLILEEIFRNGFQHSASAQWQGWLCEFDYNTDEQVFSLSFLTSCTQNPEAIPQELIVALKQPQRPSSEGETRGWGHFGNRQVLEDGLRQQKPYTIAQIPGLGCLTRLRIGLPVIISAKEMGRL